MRVSDVAAKLSTELGWRIDASQIRYYAINDFLPDVERTEGDFRKFDDNDYARLLKIVVLAKINVSSDIIKDLLNKDREAIQSAKTTLTEQDKAVKMAKEIL